MSSCHNSEKDSVSKSPQVVVLVGPQNAGKTSLFNHLTHSHFRSINYPGSTVDFAIGQLTPTITVLDTPGITSLIPRSEDERVALHCLENLSSISDQFPQHPPVVVLVIDGSLLERQLVLYRQLTRAGLSVILAITMKDQNDKEGRMILVQQLARHLSTPTVLVSNRTKEGLPELITAIETQLSILETPPSLSLPTMLSEKTLQSDFAWSQAITSKFLVQKPQASKRFDLDSIFLHPILGIFAFVFIMASLFWSIFFLVSPFMDAVDSGISLVIQGVQNTIPEGLFQQALTDGVITSIGSVLIFVPQIAMLFFLMGLLESSGYLARGAALIDRPLSAIGLSGRSFVPLLSGCACALPAMSAARTIPDKRERLTTLFVIPLMICSARLPVFGLLIYLLLPQDSHFLGGVMLTGIYLGSMVLAALISKLLSFFWKNTYTSSGFMIELPRWRRPLLRQVLMHTYHQTKSFVTRAGLPIFMVGLVLWVLNTFPTPETAISIQLGRWLDPIWKPMGINWQVGVAILLSFAAREVFVSALALMFAIQNESGLLHALSTAQHADGSLVFTPSVTIGLVVFFMISMQCLSTLVVAKKEMGGWRLPLIMSGAYIALAYVLAVAIHVIGLVLF